VLLAVGSLLFGGLAVAASQANLLPGDLEIARAVQTVHGPWIEMPLWALSAIGFPPIVGLLYGAIAASIFVSGARREGTMAAIATSGAAGLHRLIVEIVQRSRPTPELLEVAHRLPIHSSFTAGHVQNVTSFFGFLVYLVAVRLAPSWKRTLLLSLLLFAIVGMGVARVYFGEHWPTDVLGGYLLGLLWLIVVIEVYERWLGDPRAGTDFGPSKNHEHNLQVSSAVNLRGATNSLWP
jgi:undecaprenyl-diphosphatase